MLIGLASGIFVQVEHLQPGVQFMNASIWYKLVSLHAWTLSISLIAILLGTLSLVRNKTTLGLWAIWVGLSAVLLLFGGVIHLTQMNAQPDSALLDTVHTTAYLHAYGTAILMVALGGLSASKRVKLKTMSLKIPIIFGLLIAGSAVVYILLQAGLGLNGMPRRYIDYPQAFAPLQFYSSIAAIACLSLSVVYVIFLWQYSNKGTPKVEDVI